MRKVISLFVIIYAAMYVSASTQAGKQQSKPVAVPTHDTKRNQRDPAENRRAPDAASDTNNTSNATNDDVAASTGRTNNAARYFYEFTHAEFEHRLIRIEHDERGNGTILFRRKDSPEDYTEKIALSAVALERTRALWDKLSFLDSTASYDSEKDLSHLGTIKLGMRAGVRERFTELHYPANPDAFALVNEYRRITEQTLFIFDITVARESQPLAAPKVMTRLERLVARQGISDPTQLTALLQDLSTDERLPLIARNQATKLLKKIKK